MQRDVTLKSLASKLSKKQKDFYFIQAGANDGAMCDPLTNMIDRFDHWKGVFIEPSKFYMRMLKEKYQDQEQRFIFEQCAISLQSGERDFFEVKIEYSNPILLRAVMIYGDVEIPFVYDQQKWTQAPPAWRKAGEEINVLEHLRGQGSFFLENIVNSLISTRDRMNVKWKGGSPDAESPWSLVFRNLDTDPESYINKFKVKCKTINDIIYENNIKKIDLLQTDLQGYDGELILSLESFKIKPKIINFESHMMNEETKSKIKKIMIKNGYEGKISNSADSLFYRPEEVLI